ncbi:MAG: YfhO family protein [Rhodothermales bacterium]
MARKKNRKKHARTAKASDKAQEKARRPSGWDRLSGRVQHGLCVVFLLVVALGFFAPALFSGKALVGGDIVNWRASAESLLEYRETTGDEPLWATNVFAGMPGYMISFPLKTPQLDTIPRILRSVAWPVSHVVFLLLGAYLLVFFLTKNPLSSVLAACAYGLTTYLPIILVAGHNTKFIALCFAPWLVLAFVYALRKPGLLAGLLFAVALAFNLRGNHVQITYYVAFLLGIWWIVEGVGAVRKGEWKSFAVSTGWLALGAVLALLMVAHPYLSTYEYKAFSIRGAATGGGGGGLDWAYAMGWSQGVGELVTLLFADAYGGSANYWGPKSFTAGPHYVGGIVLLLAALALWRYRVRAVGVLGGGAVLMTFFALGEHFPALNRLMFNYFPLFNAWRVPETWLSVVAFALAVLAGLGLYYVVRSEPSKGAEQQKTRAIYYTLGGMLGLALVLFLGKDLFFDFEKPGEFEQVQQMVASQSGLQPDDARVLSTTQQFIEERLTPARVDLFNADALRTLLFLVLAGLALVAYRKEKLPAWAMQAALALLVVIDLAGVGRRYFNEDRLVPAPDPASQIQTFDFDRFILQKREEAGESGRFRVLSFEFNRDPSTNARPSYHYESLGGYHAAKLRLFQDFFEHLLINPTTGLPGENALDLLNTRYIVAQGAIPGYDPVYQGEETNQYVLENIDAVPRAFFVGETEVIASSEDTWARIHSETFDPGRTALLPEPLDGATTPIDSSSTASVQPLRYGPREMAWTVETDAPRLLVVSEIYYPAGWNAYIDGVPTPIHRADYLLRAVPVPAGAHEVTMRFEPASYRLSLWLAGGSTLGVYGAVIALLGLVWFRRRGGGTAAERDAPA